jgi:predicted peptidase
LCLHQLCRICYTGGKGWRQDYEEVWKNSYGGGRYGAAFGKHKCAGGAGACGKNGNKKYGGDAKCACQSGAASGNFIAFGQGGPARGVIDKSGDKKLQALLKETVPQFTQHTYHDPVSGKTLAYNLFLPQDYRSWMELPLVVFIADASTVGTDVKRPLTQGYSPAVWANKAAQTQHPCLILVPQYQGVVIDDHDGFKVTEDVEATARLIKAVAKKYGASERKLYGTGQSMGCMITMYLAAKHPDLYAAELLVSGQWDVKDLKPLATQKFFYIAAGGDPKASQGQKDLLPVLQAQGVKVSTATWDAKKSYAELSRLARKEIAKGNNINFVTFKKGSVLPAGVKDNNEHMYSFDHAYQIEAVREWLFEQYKK